MVDVAIQGLVQSEDKLCHGKLPLQGLQNSLSRRFVEVRLVQFHVDDDNDNERNGSFVEG